MIALSLGRSSRGAVNEMSVDPPCATFCTIMSMLISSPATAPNRAAATPGRSGTPSIVTFASVVSRATPEMIAFSIRASSWMTQVPGS